MADVGTRDIYEILSPPTGGGRYKLNKFFHAETLTEIPRWLKHRIRRAGNKLQKALEGYGI